MATQNLTVQTEQPLPTMGRAAVAEIEAAGKMTAELLTQLKSSKQPVLLNLDDGQTKVVLDVGDYQRLLEEAEFADMEKAIEEGLDDIENGRFQTLEEFDAEIRQRFPFLTAANVTK